MTAISLQGFKRYFVNTSWLMGHRVLNMVVALFVGVYVARYLGPKLFGLLSYADSFAGLFMALSTLGLDGIMVRELVKTPERRDELLGTAFWLKAGGAILMWIGIAAAIPFTHNDTQTNVLIAIIAFGVIFQAFNAKVVPGDLVYCNQLYFKRDKIYKAIDESPCYVKASTI